MFASRDVDLVLIEDAPDKSGKWRNFLLVARKSAGLRQYRLGWSTTTHQWAATAELGRIYQDHMSATPDLLLSAEKAMAGVAASSAIPTDSHMYRDDLLESVAAAVARESMPAVSAIIAVAGDDKAARMRISRRLQSRLPYTSKLGVLERIAVRSAPAGWIGRPPKWWLVVTPVESESGAKVVATDAKKTAEQLEIEDAVPQTEDERSTRLQMVEEARRRRADWMRTAFSKAFLDSPDGQRYMEISMAEAGEAALRAPLPRPQTDIPSDDDLPW